MLLFADTMCTAVAQTVPDQQVQEPEDPRLQKGQASGRARGLRFEGKMSMVLSLTFHARCVQERKEAEKLYPDDEAAALAASNTFEPDEDLQAAQAQAGVDTEMTDAPASTSGKAAGKAGPTPQQLIAVKAAIANAATLEEIQRLEAALVTGSLPSEFTEGGGSGAAHGDAMLVG